MCQDVKKHSDCENYSPVDVVKGICYVSNNLVMADSEVCTNFKEVSKCRNCIFFSNPERDGIGNCTGLNKEYWTNENYNAGLCDGYKQFNK